MVDRVSVYSSRCNWPSCKVVALACRVSLGKEVRSGSTLKDSQLTFPGTFGFYVKVRKAMATQEQEQSLRRISETLENHLPRNIDKPLDILLVEDNVINARILSKQLRAKGQQVHVAIHGQEALDYLRTTKYSRGSDSNAVELDVILMDWEMPVLNGIDCTKQIRQLEAQGSLTTHLPIIVTSANARPEQIEVAYAAGTVSGRLIASTRPHKLTLAIRMSSYPSLSLLHKCLRRFDK